MKRMILGKLLLIGMILLNAASAFGLAIPDPPPTPVGGEIWPYVTTGAVIGVGAWKMWRNR